MVEKLIRNHPINYLPKTNGNTPKCVYSHIFIIIHIYGVHETLSSGLTTVSPRAKNIMPSTKNITSQEKSAFELLVSVVQETPKTLQIIAIVLQRWKMRRYC